jgi:hypothetical protein
MVLLGVTIVMGCGGGDVYPGFAFFVNAKETAVIEEGNRAIGLVVLGVDGWKGGGELRDVVVGWFRVIERGVVEERTASVSDIAAVCARGVPGRKKRADLCFSAFPIFRSFLCFGKRSEEHFLLLAHRLDKRGRRLGRVGHGAVI